MKRIIVIVTRQIGDVLLTTPLIRAARVRWPDSSIDVLGFAGTLGMLDGNADVANRIEIASQSSWKTRIQLMRRIWRRYDLALVAEASDRAHLLGWAASGRRSGLVPEGSGKAWWKRLGLCHAVQVAGDRGAVHVVTEKLELLRPWYDIDRVTPKLVPPAAFALPHEIESSVRPGAVVVHVPSMWSYKQWPVEQFEALVRALLSSGRQVILTGSESDRDQRCLAPCRKVGAEPELLDLSGRLTLAQLGTLLRRVGVYVGPDTSVSHLAAAVGARVVALFGPTNPQRWAPWPAYGDTRRLFERSSKCQTRSNVTLLQGDESCVPCGRAGCEDHRDSVARCLPQITVDQVLNALGNETANTQTDAEESPPVSVNAHLYSVARASS